MLWAISEDNSQLDFGSGNTESNDFTFTISSTTFSSTELVMEIDLTEDIDIDKSFKIKFEFE